MERVDKSSIVTTPHLNFIEEDYEVLDVEKDGPSGRYLNAKCKATGKPVQIKHIQNMYRDVYFSKRVLRELTICIETSRIPK